MFKTTLFLILSIFILLSLNNCSDTDSPTEFETAKFLSFITTDDSLQKGDTLSFKIDYSDYSDIVNAQIYIDEHLFNDSLNQKDTIYWSTAKTSLGKHKILAKLISNSGDIDYNEATIYLIGRNKKPMIKCPMPAEIDRGSIVDFNLLANDSDGYISKMNLVIDGDLVQTQNNDTILSYKWHTANISIGSHSIKCEAIDNEDSISVYEKSIIVNDILPTCKIISPADSSIFDIGDLLDIETLATDEDGSVEQVVLVINDINIDTVFAQPYKFNYATSKLDTGWSQIKTIAYDNDTKTKSDSIKIYLKGYVIPKN